MIEVLAKGEVHVLGRHKGGSIQMVTPSRSARSNAKLLGPNTSMEFRRARQTVGLPRVVE